jgi:hypothetical protein
MLLCKLLAFLVAHCTPVRQIRFVSDQHYGHVSIRVLPRVFQPAGKVVEGLPPVFFPGFSKDCISTIPETMRIRGLLEQLQIYWAITW